MSRNSLLEAGAKSEGEVTATRLEPRTTQFLNEHSTIWPNLASLAKWLSVRLRTNWFWVRVQLQKQVGLFIKVSRLNVFIKTPRFLLLTVKLKSPINITFSY